MDEFFDLDKALDELEESENNELHRSCAPLDRGIQIESAITTCCNSTQHPKITNGFNGDIYCQLDDLTSHDDVGTVVPTSHGENDSHGDAFSQTRCPPVLPGAETLTGGQLSLETNATAIIDLYKRDDEQSACNLYDAPDGPLSTASDISVVDGFETSSSQQAKDDVITLNKLPTDVNSHVEPIISNSDTADISHSSISAEHSNMLDISSNVSESGKTSDEPSKMLEESCIVSEKYSKVSEGPIKISAESNNMSEEPCIVLEEPRKLSEEPSILSEKVSNVSKEPSKVSEETSKLSEEPSKLSEESSSKVSDKPSVVSDECSILSENAEGSEYARTRSNEETTAYKDHMTAVLQSSQNDDVDGKYNHGVVGFASVDDLDLDNDEMEQYLSTIGGPDNYTEFDSKPSFDDVQLEPCAEPTPGDDVERRGSGSSVEKFLVPMVMTPSITTPLEDPGYSKVPGYTAPVGQAIPEEEEEDTSVKVTSETPFPHSANDSFFKANIAMTTPADATLADTDSRGARPKDSIVRINRPNSLLGLSSPGFAVSVDDSGVRHPVDGNTVFRTCRTENLNISARDSGIVADSDECSNCSPPCDITNPKNVHDLINAKLLMKKSLPLVKKPMSLGEGTLAGDTKSQASVDVVAEETVTQQKRPSSLLLSSQTASAGMSIVTDGNVVTGDEANSATDEDITDDEHLDQPSTGNQLYQAQSSADVMQSPDVAVVSPPTSHNINLAITQLGKVAPVWVPDNEAAACMQCEARFTFTKRRHHCRACGKVFCNGCCNLRSRLHYMENKEARVCSKCYQDLIRAQVYERMHQPSVSPNPSNPSEYCSTIPPLQQASAAPMQPPSVMVPSGVLRKDGTQRRSVEAPKQVMFSDGIRPGGDLTELDEAPSTQLPTTRHGRRVRRLDKSEDRSVSSHGRERPSVCLIPERGLPPVLLSTGVKGDFSIEEDPDPDQILPKIRSTEDPEPVVFAINKNLFVIVKIVTLDCCVNRQCWCFSTRGMCTVGQDEIVIVLECLPEEKSVPRDIFCHLHAVYEEASKGNTVSHLGHTIFAQGFLDCQDHSGFLYINASYQCLHKLILPPHPFIFGILLQRWETPWAKVFPIRLMLRLGAEYRYYPCPLISVRYRKPVFGEIGHTIMNLLADFRNYQYMLPQVPGVTIHMEDKHTFINLPRNRYKNMMKVLTNSNDHVMALGANFSMSADSHLVCIQNDDGSYQTQAINIQNKPRKVTGASFVVFNGAFKPAGVMRSKSSIVEDGLMVQITAEMMVELKEAMRNMVDYDVACGDLSAPEEAVTVRWVDDDTNFNTGVLSPVDLAPMDGKESIRIHSATDFVGDRHTIRWTECFFIENQMDGGSAGDPVDLSRLAENLAQSMCLALTPYLTELQQASLTKIGLRATIDPDKTCYEVGSNGSRLSDQYMDRLDSALIPIIHSAASTSQRGPAILELIFHIIE